MHVGGEGHLGPENECEQKVTDIDSMLLIDCPIQTPQNLTSLLDNLGDE